LHLYTVLEMYSFLIHSTRTCTRDLSTCTCTRTRTRTSSTCLNSAIDNLYVCVLNCCSIKVSHVGNAEYAATLVINCEKWSQLLFASCPTTWRDRDAWNGPHTRSIVLGMLYYVTVFWVVWGNWTCVLRVPFDAGFTNRSTVSSVITLTNSWPTSGTIPLTSLTASAAAS
jgi:hypothetical protein